MRFRRQLLAVVLLATVACRPGTSESTESGTPAPSTTIVTPSIAPDTDPRVAEAVDVPGQPRGLVLHDGLLWVSSARADRLTAIDASTMQVTAEIDVGPTPVSVLALDGDLWVSLVDGGQLGDGQGLARIDPATGGQAERITVPVFHNVVAAAGAFWVLDGETGLQRIDPATGTVSTIDVGSATQTIAGSADAIWGVGEDGTLWRADTSGEQVTTTSNVDRAIGGRTRLAEVDGELWIGAPGAVLVRDALTLEAVESITIDGLEFVNDVEAAGDTVWIAATVRVPSRAAPLAVLLGFDRERHHLRDSITFGREAGEIVVDGSTLWAADQGSDRVVQVRLR